VLYDSISMRSILEPYPNNPVAVSLSNSAIATTVPTYTSGVLDPQGQQTIGSSIQGNVVVGTGSGTLKQVYMGSTYLQAYATQNMNFNDRLRGHGGVVEIVTNGFDWGNNGSANRSRRSAVGVQGTTQVTGSGTVGAVAGMTGSIMQAGTGGTANLNYAAGSFSAIQQTGSGTLTIDNACLVGGTIVANPGTITNAVGMYLPDNWASSGGGGSVTNKYSILSEDSGSKMSHAGVVGIGVFASTALPTGVVGDTIAISDGGGKLAYWDTTNTRWSYVWSNLAV
jgi:hypothetical protein